MLRSTLVSFKQRKKFLLHHSHVFKHACATPLTILFSNLEQDLNDYLVKDIYFLGSDGFNKKLICEKNKKRVKSSLEATKKLIELMKSSVGKVRADHQFSIVEAVNEVVILLKGRLRSRYFEVKMLIDKDLSLVGNKLYFQEALTCLINNAVEAYKNKKEKPITLLVRKEQNYLKLDVVDYASGMNVFLQKIVFFSGLTTKKKGSGLGLKFTKYTVTKLFAGKLVIKSALDCGTHVVMKIPLR